MPISHPVFLSGLPQEKTAGQPAADGMIDNLTVSAADSRDYAIISVLFSYQNHAFILSSSILIGHYRSLWVTTNQLCNLPIQYHK